MLQRHRFALVLVGIFIASLYVGTTFAAAGPYLGSGYFFTSNLNWAFSGIQTNQVNASYQTQANNAMADWNATDLNLTYNQTWKVLVNPVNQGNNGLNGHIFICAPGGGQCGGASGPYPSEYGSCVAYINNTYTYGWASSSLKSLILHETGHCWSLAHRDNDATSVMRQMINGYNMTNTVPNQNDKDSVNARY